ncbi:MAG: hypothetical protein KDK34_02005, partial [Leptospiraceae bacterium]|nr:hypothetical protein [Leptospiraceae bacterium]
EGRWNSERSVRNVFMLMMWLLTALTLLALTRAIRRREKTLLVPAAVLACYGVGHAISYLDINYYYFKQPFLYLFAGYALSGLWYPERKLPVALRFIGGIIGGTWVVLTVILYGMLVSF